MEYLHGFAVTSELHLTWRTKSRALFASCWLLLCTRLSCHQFFYKKINNSTGNFLNHNVPKQRLFVIKLGMLAGCITFCDVFLCKWVLKGVGVSWNNMLNPCGICLAPFVSIISIHSCYHWFLVLCNANNIR